MSESPAYRVFISYAHVDNDAPAGTSGGGWVSHFARDLENSVRRCVGRPEHVAFFFDNSSLRRNEKLTPQIVAAVQASTVFVLLMSTGWVQSKWCQAELQAFIETPKPDLDSRIFAVELLPVAQPVREAVLLDAATGTGPLKDRVPYEAYAGKGDDALTLAWPTPNPRDPAHQAYYEFVNRLGAHLRSALVRYGAPVPRVESRQAPAAGAGVFLGAVTDDNVARRKEVARYLEIEGVDVWPKRSLPRDPAEYVKTVREEMANARAFVQLLSELPGQPPADMPEGVLWAQYSIARERGLQILQWTSEGTPRLEALGAAVEPHEQRHRELLGLETLAAEPLEVFKHRVVEIALKPPEPERRTASGSEPFVFVNAEKSDRGVGRHILEYLSRRFYAVMPAADGSSEDLREDLEANLRECDGLILVYGSSSQAWVNSQVREIRKAGRNRKEPLRVVALVTAPPLPKNEIPGGVPGMRVLPFDANNDAWLREVSTAFGV